MTDPRDHEVFLEDAKDILEFVETHEREGSGVASFFGGWLRGILEENKQHGRYDWPALLQLFGPRSADMLEGPHAGLTVPIYEVRYVCAPTKDVQREEARNLMQVHHMGFIIEDGELIECILDIKVN